VFLEKFGLRPREVEQLTREQYNDYLQIMSIKNEMEKKEKEEAKRKQKRSKK